MQIFFQDDTNICLKSNNLFFITHFNLFICPELFFFLWLRQPKDLSTIFKFQIFLTVKKVKRSTKILFYNESCALDFFCVAT